MRWTLRCPHADLVAHLEAEVTWLKAQMLYERARAKRAFDLLLAARASVPAVRPPRDDGLLRELGAVLQDDEFTHAGALG